jgi:hypothetical protein
MNVPATLFPMTRRKSLVLWLLTAFALAVAACGGESAEPSEPSAGSPEPFNTPYKDAKAFPVFISSEIVVGENRFLVGLLDDHDAPIGVPAIDVHISFFDLREADADPTAQKDMDFIWTVPGERGVYVTRASFDHAGEWGAEVSIEGQGIDERLRGSFVVKENGTTPGIGDRAPSVDTPTARDVDDLSEISTDTHPDPHFYRLSVKQALSSNRPFVLTFATPKFCQTAVCGPTLDVVKAVARDFPRMTFIHVEPYEDLNNIGKVVPAVVEWGLKSEPWVFVVDEEGMVRAKFEGVLGKGELRQALKTL